jgi:molybdopterin biosynthesis enzyme
MARDQDQFLDVVDRDTALGRWWSSFCPEVLESEQIALAAPLTRVLAIDIAAPADVPRFDRSNVDGYAVQVQDTFGTAEEGPRGFLINDEEVTTGRVLTTTRWVRPAVAALRECLASLSVRVRLPKAGYRVDQEGPS